jgi:hypothetical protein
VTRRIVLMVCLLIELVEVWQLHWVALFGPPNARTAPIVDGLAGTSIMIAITRILVATPAACVALLVRVVPAVP